jgi:hypothetical protein
MPFNLHKQLFAGCIITFLSFQNYCDAFGVTSSIQRPTVSTALQAEKAPRRRDFFDAVKRVFVGAGTAAALNKKTTRPAFAEDSVAGRIVEVKVANVGGELGGEGTVRIQLRPDWAPRGVSRFEVGDMSCSFW